MSRSFIQLHIVRAKHLDFRATATSQHKTTDAKGIPITTEQVKTIEFWPYEHTHEELNYEN